MAYSLPHSDELFIHSGWTTTKVSVATKTKTVILLNEKHEPIGFGEDAKFKLKINIFIKSASYMCIHIYIDT